MLMAQSGRVASRLVVVCALGYFVDIYDLILFSIVRVQSLKDLGVTDPVQIQSVGAQLLSWQMGGMLLGGILWGVIGDRRGRRAILYGSIALYSAANLANAWVWNVPSYAALRFIAGLGLAGELGAAVTLVSEAMPAARRGYGTMVVSAVGILGAAAGFAVAKAFDWRIAYVVGGLMGITLLVARLRIAESSLFARIAPNARRGDLRMFLGTPRAGGWDWLRGNGDRLRRLVLTAVIGVPLWCVVGILVTFSPEISTDLGIRGAVDAPTAVLLCYVAASVGSLASGTLSQFARSRRTAVLAFLAFTIAAGGSILLLRGGEAWMFYAAVTAMGFGAGYWAVFVQMGAEQFGTDLRATVATAVPNLARGSVVVLAPAYALLTGALHPAGAAVALLAATVLVANVGAWGLPETFGRDLDHVEPLAGPSIRPSPAAS